MEKLKIDGFLGLKKIELDINDINLIIGPQASGKSVIAKTLHFAKSIFSELSSTIENEQTKTELNSKLKTKFNDYFPSDSWSNTVFKIEYQINDFFFQIIKENKTKKSVKLEFSPEYSRILSKGRAFHKRTLQKLAEDKRHDIWEVNFKTQKYINDLVNDRIGVVASNSQLYIPAGRAFFANLQSSIFSFLSSNNAIDPFLKEFGSFYESVKKFPGRINSEKENLIKQINLLGKEVLFGEFKYEKGKDYLILKDGRKLNLSNCSSGQQEVLPLILTLTVLTKLNFLGDGATVYIEEPEAHLFPTAQKKVIDLFSMVFNNSKSKIQFIITTHSPYILTSLNNNLQAGAIDKELNDDQKDKLYQIVDKNYIIYPEKVSAFSIKNGASDTIMCEETKLISSQIIDDVSNELSIQFGNLLDLE